MIAGHGLMATGLALLALPPPPGLPAAGWLSFAAALSGVGLGMAAPAGNNASMHLAKQEIAAVAGLRGMFRQTGGIVAVSLTTAAVSLSSRPGLAQAVAFAVSAALLAATLPLIVAMPDHRGRW
ncbi:hypothetical protein BJF78_25655 [Pseudonocardia sp. CNS-139]|nr:hypothetical protein BJF78_25655 [Pseudonocardia sp. CNS-139]